MVTKYYSEEELQRIKNDGEARWKELAELDPASFPLRWIENLYPVRTVEEIWMVLGFLPLRRFLSLKAFFRKECRARAIMSKGFYQLDRLQDDEYE